LEARIVASSVYAQGKIEVLDSEGSIVAQEHLDGGDAWRKISLSIPLKSEPELTLSFWSRFAKRRDEDGFWVRDLVLKTGEEKSRETILLDGGYEDGHQERRALVQLLETGSLQELERLERLRRGLPSLKSSLALASLLENESQVGALLKLFAQLKEEAVQAFSLLKELASGEDLDLQASVLLTSGLENYPSTRDHLGDGLLSLSEFEDNCRLYLELREGWTEDEARRGLSLLLTPVAAEDSAERRRQFVQLFQAKPEAASFFQAWDAYWSA
jgi:hypothetical protein